MVTDINYQESIEQSSVELSKLIDTITYITRIDNPYVFYEYYMPGHSPLKMYSQEHNSSITNEILTKPQDETIASKDLIQILNQLIALQKAGTRIESKRIPLLLEEYKFKGYRQVEFIYKDSNDLHVITVTNKKKAIHFKHAISICT